MVGGEYYYSVVVEPELFQRVEYLSESTVYTGYCGEIVGSLENLSA